VSRTLALLKHKALHSRDQVALLPDDNDWYEDPNRRAQLEQLVGEVVHVDARIST
jgi:hypothetical protein